MIDSGSGLITIDVVQGSPSVNSGSSLVSVGAPNPLLKEFNLFPA